MSNAILASSKEEKEKLLNIRIEQIKKKNEELLNKHKLIEEDKRIAELQGRTLKSVRPVHCGDNQVADKTKNNHFKKGRSEEMVHSKLKTSTPPMEPMYNFLFDKMRDGPGESEERKSKTRRHPRNYGGINFEDVPKKIQQERAKQNNYWQNHRHVEVDYTLVTTGKERREMDEWRKEREEIDRKRLQRQRKNDGGWKREWDQNKDESFFVESDQHSGDRLSPQDKKHPARMWVNKNGPQRHYNKVYHQKRRIRRNVPDILQPQAPRGLQERNNEARNGFPWKPVASHLDGDQQRSVSSTDHLESSSLSPRSDSRKEYRKNAKNGSWRSWRLRSEPNERTENVPGGSNGTQSATPTKPNPAADKIVMENNVSSPKKMVRFADPTSEENKEPVQEKDKLVMKVQHPDARPEQRSGRNFIGSGRLSRGQKYKMRGHRYRRDFNARSPDQLNSHSPKFGSHIRRVYLDEAMCKSVETSMQSPELKSETVLVADSEVKDAPPNDSQSSGDVGTSAKSDDSEKKSADEGGEGEDEDEDEQWEDIDEEICLELDHRLPREEVTLDASSESFDQFIINNTLRLEVADPVEVEADLLGGRDGSMGPRGGYPDVLDWEDDGESVSHLSDGDKFTTSESSDGGTREAPSSENATDDSVKDEEHFIQGLSAPDRTSIPRENEIEDGVVAGDDVAQEEVAKDEVVTQPGAALEQQTICATLNEVKEQGAIAKSPEIPKDSDEIVSDSIEGIPG